MVRILNSIKRKLNSKWTDARSGFGFKSDICEMWMNETVTCAVCVCCWAFAGVRRINWTPPGCCWTITGPEDGRTYAPNPIKMINTPTSIKSSITQSGVLDIPTDVSENTTWKTCDERNKRIYYQWHNSTAVLPKHHAADSMILKLFYGCGDIETWNRWNITHENQDQDVISDIK